MRFYIPKTNTMIFSFIKKCELAVFEIFARQTFLARMQRRQLVNQN